jgi:alpha,alpha-trehalose phosphorylase
MMDLHDLEHNTRDGLHIASLAGSWLAVVAGFGGLRDCGDLLAFTPQRPPGIDEFEFAITWQGACLHVRVGDHVTYSRDRGRDEDDPVAFSHHGERLELRNGESVIRPLVRVEPITATPMQPRGRAPLASDAG